MARHVGRISFKLEGMYLKIVKTFPVAAFASSILKEIQMEKVAVVVAEPPRMERGY